jgi:hypothetical protein
MNTKVLVHKTKQTIEEETYYSCSDEIWQKIKEANTDDERWKIWKDFNIWDSEIVGEESNNCTDEEVGHGIHHD